MNKLLFYCGLIFFVGSLILLKTNYYQVEIADNGILVEMPIENMPDNCTRKSGYHISLLYNNRRYFMKVSGTYCKRHEVGEFVQVKMLDKYNRVLLPNEKGIVHIFSYITLSVIGLLTAIVYGKKVFQK